MILINYEKRSRARSNKQDENNFKKKCITKYVLNYWIHLRKQFEKKDWEQVIKEAKNKYIKEVV